MLVEDVEARRTEIALCQEAHYWRALHARAVKREAAWKERAGQLERIVRGQAAQIAELTRENEALKARVTWLEQQVFGRKSELPQDVTPEAQDGDGNVPAGPEPSTVKRRKRGKQRGTKGHGRKRRSQLPTEEVIHDLPADQRRCPICGKPFVVFPGTDDSDLIEWEVRLVRRVHKRTRYRSACNCQALEDG